MLIPFQNRIASLPAPTAEAAENQINNGTASDDSENQDLNKQIQKIIKQFIQFEVKLESFQQNHKAIKSVNDKINNLIYNSK